jgi:hypothetical protein
MLQIKIDNYPFKCMNDLSILEACSFLGFYIPRFCYHESLSVAGSCRMCLVKIESDEKPILSCLTQIDNGFEILINDPYVKKARSNILNFLLLNHPLDCPICDQAGECDLQDQFLNFGGSFSRNFFNKRGVEDKLVNPFIKTIMSRCIHCTRCVRFDMEIVNGGFFSVLGRGFNTEIGNYLKTNSLNSEFSSNVIDLCPVGALTSKVYSFKARPWELVSTETIDLTDGFGSNIYVDTSGIDVVRVYPRDNKEINNTLITDKARFSYDAFTNSHSLIQLTTISDFINRSFNFNDFHKFLNEFNKYFNIKEKNLILINEELSLEYLDLFNNISILFPSVELCSISSKNDSNFFINLNNDISSLNVYDSIYSCFLFSVNPKIENALINIKLNNLINNNFLKIYSLGYKYKSNFNSFFINLSMFDLITFFQGKNILLSSLLFENSPLFIIGSSLKKRGICFNFLKFFFCKINSSILFFNIYNKANSLGVSYFNIKPLNKNILKKAKTYFCYKLKENFFLRKNFLFNDKFIFWLNTHKSLFLIRKGFEIPVKNLFQENGIFLNLEFRPQISKIAILDSNFKSSFFFFKSLFFSKFFKKTSHLYFFFKLAFYNDKFFILKKKNISLFIDKKFKKLNFLSISSYPNKPQLDNFYISNYYTQYSKNMLVSSNFSNKYFNNFCF